MNMLLPKTGRTNGNSSVFIGVSIVLLLCFGMPQIAVAQAEKSQSAQKQEKPLNNKTSTEKPSESGNTTQKSEASKSSDSSDSTDADESIDWGDWDTELAPAQTQTGFGVGIQGKIESELSRIDKSNLLQNASGVATTKNSNDTGISKKPRDLKKTMAELEALEAKVKKEIEDDSEF